MTYLPFNIHIILSGRWKPICTKWYAKLIIIIRYRYFHWDCFRRRFCSGCGSIMAGGKWVNTRLVIKKTLSDELLFTVKHTMPPRNEVNRYMSCFRHIYNNRHTCYNKFWSLTQWPIAGSDLFYGLTHDWLSLMRRVGMAVVGEKSLK